MSRRVVQARVSRNDLAYYAREPFFADFVQVRPLNTQSAPPLCPLQTRCLGRGLDEQVVIKAAVLS